MDVHVVPSHLWWLINHVRVCLEFALVALRLVRRAFCELRTIWNIVCRRFEPIAVGADWVFVLHGVDQPFYTDDLAVCTFLDRIDYRKV